MESGARLGRGSVAGKPRPKVEGYPRGGGRARCRGGLRSGNGVSQSRGETGGAARAGEGTGTRAIALGAIEEGFGGGRARERTRLAHAAQKHLGRERAGLARTHARARGGERRGRRAEARAGGARLGSGGGWDLSTTARVRAARRLLGDPRRDVVVHDGNRDARPAPRSARRRSGRVAATRAERRVETISNAPPRRKPSAAGESSAKSENCRRAARQLPHRPRCASPSRLGALRPAASLGPARIHHGFERRWR